MPVKLAIVIPAYKAKHFNETMQSLAAQTNKNFNVYIGDDCSPDDLKTIINAYQNQLSISYHRFTNNIGAKDLVKQWNRCVALSEGEEWICLFADDDILDKNCVEEFYRFREREPDYEVYRFNTMTIGDSGQVLCVNPTGPLKETSEEMAYHLLNGRRGNVIGDHIFSRKVFDRYGSFVITDYAQGADWASSILFSHERGICIIPDGFYHWRYSGENISSRAFTIRSQTMNGHLQFIEWVVNHFQYLQTNPSTVSFHQILTSARSNLHHVLIHHYRGFDLNQTLKLIRFHIRVLRRGIVSSIKDVSQIKLTTSSCVKRFRRALSIPNGF